MRFGEVSDHRDVMYQIQSLLLHIRGTILNVPFLAITPTPPHSLSSLLSFSPLVAFSNPLSLLPPLPIFGEMRIQKLIPVLCLLLWACIGSNTVARKTVLVSNLFDGAKKNMPLHGARKCNPKRHLSCYDNNTTSSDDKRLVPTGPNPLHN
ncbi:hypothetical protein CR513_12433, partial [Mucuna pruriens]